MIDNAPPEMEGFCVTRSMLEAVFAMPSQKLWMRSGFHIDWWGRKSGPVYEGTNTVRVIRLPRDEDLEIVSETYEATVKHPVCSS